MQIVDHNHIREWFELDKVESNDGSFEVLPSDPSIIFNEAVKNCGEIAEPLLDCVLKGNVWSEKKLSSNART